MTQSVSRTVTVAASPSEIFDLLAEPARHAEIDGSGTVKGQLRGPSRLSLGAKFGMKMRVLVPYVITNEVVEFEPDRRIAWRHVGHHVWRYELTGVEGGTSVTETFDWAPSRSPKALELMRYPARNAAGIEATLARLVSRFGAVG